MINFHKEKNLSFNQKYRVIHLSKEHTKKENLAFLVKKKIYRYFKSKKL